MSESTQDVSLALILHQGQMIRTWGRVFAKSFLPFVRNGQNPEKFQSLASIIPAPADELVTAYADWSGAPGQYPDSLPPHMFCQWSLAPAIQVIEQSRYNVAEVVNQGVTMRMHGPLPRDQSLVVRASLESLKETEGRADLAVKVVTGTRETPKLVEAILHVAFMLDSPSRRSAAVRALKPAPDSEWDNVGSWQAGPKDGFHFAVLTGDFNPIHWLESAGKKSPFGRTVLQGLGMLARTYEQLKGHIEFKEIDVRFQRPVPLPSGNLHVEYAPALNGGHVIRLVDENRRVRLSGHCR